MDSGKSQQHARARSLSLPGPPNHAHHGNHTSHNWENCAHVANCDDDDDDDDVMNRTEQKKPKRLRDDAPQRRGSWRHFWRDRSPRARLAKFALLSLALFLSAFVANGAIVGLHMYRFIRHHELLVDTVAIGDLCAMPTARINVRLAVKDPVGALKFFHVHAFKPTVLRLLVPGVQGPALFVAEVPSFDLGTNGHAHPETDDEPISAYENGRWHLNLDTDRDHVKLHLNAEAKVKETLEYLLAAPIASRRIVLNVSFGLSTRSFWLPLSMERSWNIDLPLSKHPDANDKDKDDDDLSNAVSLRQVQLTDRTHADFVEVALQVAVKPSMVPDFLHLHVPQVHFEVGTRGGGSAQGRNHNDHHRKEYRLSDVFVPEQTFNRHRPYGDVVVRVSRDHREALQRLARTFLISHANGDNQDQDIVSESVISVRGSDPLEHQLCRPPSDRKQEEGASDSSSNSNSKGTCSVCGLQRFLACVDLSHSISGLRQFLASRSPVMSPGQFTDAGVDDAADGLASVGLRRVRQVADVTTLDFEATTRKPTVRRLTGVDLTLLQGKWPPVQLEAWVEHVCDGDASLDATTRAWTRLLTVDLQHQLTGDEGVDADFLSVQASVSLLDAHLASQLAASLMLRPSSGGELAVDNAGGASPGIGPGLGMFKRLTVKGVDDTLIGSLLSVFQVTWDLDNSRGAVGSATIEPVPRPTTPEDWLKRLFSAPENCAAVTVDRRGQGDRPRLCHQLVAALTSSERTIDLRAKLSLNKQEQVGNVPPSPVTTKMGRLVKMHWRDVQLTLQTRHPRHSGAIVDLLTVAVPKGAVLVDPFILGRSTSTAKALRGGILGLHASIRGDVEANEGQGLPAVLPDLLRRFVYGQHNVHLQLRLQMASERTEERGDSMQAVVIPLQLPPWRHLLRRPSRRQAEADEPIPGGRWGRLLRHTQLRVVGLKAATLQALLRFPFSSSTVDGDGNDEHGGNDDDGNGGDNAMVEWSIKMALPALDLHLCNQQTIIHNEGDDEGSANAIEEDSDTATEGMPTVGQCLPICHLGVHPVDLSASFRRGVLRDLSVSNHSSPMSFFSDASHHHYHNHHSSNSQHRHHHHDQMAGGNNNWIPLTGSVLDFERLVELLDATASGLPGLAVSPCHVDGDVPYVVSHTSPSNSGFVENDDDNNMKRMNLVSKLVGQVGSHFPVTLPTTNGGTSAVPAPQIPVTHRPPIEHFWEETPAELTVRLRSDNWTELAMDARLTIPPECFQRENAPLPRKAPSNQDDGGEHRMTVEWGAIALDFDAEGNQVQVAMTPGRIDIRLSDDAEANSPSSSYSSSSSAVFTRDFNFSLKAKLAKVDFNSGDARRLIHHVRSFAKNLMTPEDLTRKRLLSRIIRMRASVVSSSEEAASDGHGSATLEQDVRALDEDGSRASDDNAELATHDDQSGGRMVTTYDTQWHVPTVFKILKALFMRARARPSHLQHLWAVWQSTARILPPSALSSSGDGAQLSPPGDAQVPSSSNIVQLLSASEEFGTGTFPCLVPAMCHRGLLEQRSPEAPLLALDTETTVIAQLLTDTVALLVGRLLTKLDLARHPRHLLLRPLLDGDVCVNLAVNDVDLVEVRVPKGELVALERTATIVYPGEDAATTPAVSEQVARIQADRLQVRLLLALPKFYHDLAGLLEPVNLDPLFRLALHRLPRYSHSSPTVPSLLAASADEPQDSLVYSPLALMASNERARRSNLMSTLACLALAEMPMGHMMTHLGSAAMNATTSDAGSNGVTLQIRGLSLPNPASNIDIVLEHPIKATYLFPRDRPRAEDPPQGFRVAWGKVMPPDGRHFPLTLQAGTSQSVVLHGRLSLDADGALHPDVDDEDRAVAQLFATRAALGKELAATLEVEVHPNVRFQMPVAFPTREVDLTFLDTEHSNIDPRSVHMITRFLYQQGRQLAETAASWRQYLAGWYRYLFPTRHNNGLDHGNNVDHGNDDDNDNDGANGSNAEVEHDAIDLETTAPMQTTPPMIDTSGRRLMDVNFALSLKNFGDFVMGVHCLHVDLSIDDADGLSILGSRWNRHLDRVLKGSLLLADPRCFPASTSALSPTSIPVIPEPDSSALRGWWSAMQRWWTSIATGGTSSSNITSGPNSTNSASSFSTIINGTNITSGTNTTANITTREDFLRCVHQHPARLILPNEHLRDNRRLLAPVQFDKWPYYVQAVDEIVNHDGLCMNLDGLFSLGLMDDRDNTFILDLSLHLNRIPIPRPQLPAANSNHANSGSPSSPSRPSPTAVFTGPDGRIVKPQANFDPCRKLSGPRPYSRLLHLPHTVNNNELQGELRLPAGSHGVLRLEDQGVPLESTFVLQMVIDFGSPSGPAAPFALVFHADHVPLDCRPGGDFGLGTCFPPANQHPLNSSPHSLSSDSRNHWLALAFKPFGIQNSVTLLTNGQAVYEKRWATFPPRCRQVLLRLTYLGYDRQFLIDIFPLTPDENNAMAATDARVLVDRVGDHGVPKFHSVVNVERQPDLTSRESRGPSLASHLSSDSSSPRLTSHLSVAVNNQGGRHAWSIAAFRMHVVRPDIARTKVFWPNPLHPLPREEGKVVLWLRDEHDLPMAAVADHRGRHRLRARLRLVDSHRPRSVIAQVQDDDVYAREGESYAALRPRYAAPDSLLVFDSSSDHAPSENASSNDDAPSDNAPWLDCQVRYLGRLGLYEVAYEAVVPGRYALLLADADADEGTDALHWTQVKWASVYVRHYW